MEYKLFIGSSHVGNYDTLSDAMNSGSSRIRLGVASGEWAIVERNGLVERVVFDSLTSR